MWCTDIRALDVARGYAAALNAVLRVLPTAAHDHVEQYDRDAGPRSNVRGQAVKVHLSKKGKSTWAICCKTATTRETLHSDFVADVTCKHCLRIAKKFFPTQASNGHHLRCTCDECSAANPGAPT